jgi:hypothetical protein
MFPLLTLTSVFHGKVCLTTWLASAATTLSDPLDWALPDQLVFSTVSALLRLSSSHPQYAEQATSAICDFIAKTVKKIETSRRKWCQGPIILHSQGSSAGCADTIYTCCPWVIPCHQLNLISLDLRPVGSPHFTHQHVVLP